MEQMICREKCPPWHSLRLGANLNLWWGRIFLKRTYFVILSYNSNSWLYLRFNFPKTNRQLLQTPIDDGWVMTVLLYQKHFIKI